MLDSTSSTSAAMIDAAEETQRKASRKRRENTQKAVAKALETSTVSPAAIVEEPAVMAAAGFMGPFAMAAEATMFWRRSRGLATCWSQALMKCKSPEDLIATNAHFGEKAMALGFSESFRVLERCALLGRQAAAPSSLALRDSDKS